MNVIQTYQDALDYIYSFVDFSRTHQQNLAPENFDLSRVRALMNRLGNPQNSYPTIHVAGSKGKGSVCAFCASALEAEGYKVGLYTSPHMESFTERMRINGEQIADEKLVAILNEIKPHIEAIPKITTFEIITALGFTYFGREKVDIAVIEVGLGGRLDATNVIMPKVSVITQLYLEHTFVLGNTLAEIAGEKGGIIKQQVPVVISTQTDEANATLMAIAHRKNAPVYAIGREYLYQPDNFSLEGQSFRVWRKGMKEAGKHLAIPLLGDFQIENAATAFAALDVLRNSGFPLTDDAIERGFQNTCWEGRFEVLRKTFPPVVVDSAHNKDAVIKLVKTVEKYFPNKDVVLVVGVSADKNIRGMLDEFGPVVKKIICTQSTHPRALDSNVLCAMAAEYFEAPLVVKDVPEACRKAVEIASKDDLVLITGSIFVVAGAKIWWRNYAENDRITRLKAND